MILWMERSLTRYADLAPVRAFIRAFVDDLVITKAAASATIIIDDDEIELAPKATSSVIK